MIGSTSFADRCCALDELESAFIRDVVERTTFPMYTINVDIKYKLADLEDAFNDPQNQLHVTGHIQSRRQTKIDSSNLLRWFQATWSPIDGQLVRNDAYRDWSRPDPAYRHAQVHGEPAVATRGPGKKKVCVRPNPQNLNSLISPSSIRVLTCICLTYRPPARPLPQRSSGVTVSSDLNRQDVCRPILAERTLRVTLRWHGIFNLNRQRRPDVKGFV